MQGEDNGMTFSEYKKKPVLTNIIYKVKIYFRNKREIQTKAETIYPSKYVS